MYSPRDCPQALSDATSIFPLHEPCHNRGLAQALPPLCPLLALVILQGFQLKLHRLHLLNRKVKRGHTCTCILTG